MHAGQVVAAVFAFVSSLSDAGRAEESKLVDVWSESGQKRMSADEAPDGC